MVQTMGGNMNKQKLTPMEDSDGVRCYSIPVWGITLWVPQLASLGKILNCILFAKRNDENLQTKYEDIVYEAKRKRFTSV